MAEVKTKYDHMTSFGFSFCLYAVVSVAARIVPILVRTLLSLFVHTPSVTELKADGSYLFNVIYPLFGLLMLGSYFAAMYYGFRFAASKVSYRTLKQTSDFRIATELALVLAAGLVFDVYLMFSMELRSEFWYVAALIASFTGVVDKTNLLAIVSERDLQLNYFTLEGLTPNILGIGVVVTLVLTAAAFLPAYYGCRQGEVMGISAYRADKSAFRQSLGIDPSEDENGS